MEHRRYPRVARSLPIGLSCRGHPHGTFVTRNLSVQGLFLESGPTDLQPGDPVMLHIETTLAGIAMTGNVTRLTEHGIGVMLTHYYLDYAHDVLTALAREGRIIRPDWYASAHTTLRKPRPAFYQPAARANDKR